MRRKIKVVRRFEEKSSNRRYLVGEIFLSPEEFARRYVSRGDAVYIDDLGGEDLTIDCVEPKVSVVILVKDALDYVKQCIDSVLKHTDNYELIIVDNASGVETKEYLKNIRCPEYTLITNDENVGVSYGWNQGIKVAKYEYICFLNSDCIVTAEWLKKLVRGFKYSDEIAITGPSSNGGATVKSHQIVGNIPVEKIDEYAKGLKDDFVECCVVGFCFVISKKLFDKIGVFDHKRYGLACHEDIDILYRCRKAELKSLWCSGAFVYHWGNRTMLEMDIDVNEIRVRTEKILSERYADPNIYIENDVKQGRVDVICENKIKIGFVTLQNIETDRVANTRLRVEWPLKYMPDSFISESYEELKKCDVVVFQSRHEINDLEMAIRLKNEGIRLIWDFSDPSWLKEYDPSAIHPILYKVAQYADCVTLPTEELARTYREAFKHSNIEIVKDRLALGQYTKIKKHTDRKKFKICWFGSYGNFCSIDLAREDLERLGKEFDITFTCVYDTGNRHNVQIKPFKNIKLDVRTWTNQVTTDAILESDLTINPRFYNHWKSYKSNNKTITSWVCGVPCVENNFYNEIKKYLLSSELRNKEGIEKREIVIKEYGSEHTALEWYEVAKRLLSKPKVKAKKNITVYTSICGGYDNLQENQFRSDNADYVAFLDKEYRSNTWDIKKVFTQFMDPSRQAKIYKVLPWLYMDSEYSIWMDGGVSLQISPSMLIEQYLKDADIALFKHHSRDDIYEEYAADPPHLHRKLEPEYLYRMQIERYAKEGFPRHSGLYECTVIIRRHTEAVKRLCEMWWSEISAYTVCDQHSFMYCVTKQNIKVNILPGTIHRNEFIIRDKHIKGYQVNG